MLITDAPPASRDLELMGWIDIEKAYDRVPHEWETSKLERISGFREWSSSNVDRFFLCRTISLTVPMPTS